ncbi:MAG: DNA topology modulation protein [Flammeovirgaceae bacterium]
MKRVMIIGSCGAGKSTLSLKVQQRLGIALIHLDQLYWKPNWVESSKEEFRAKVAEAVKQDTWIMDGNYGSTLDIRLARADTIVFLDLSRWVCLRRVIMRWITNLNQTRSDMTEGCKEKLDLEFLHYIYTYPTNKRPKILNTLARLKPHQQVYHLKNRQDIGEFLLKCQKGIA